MEGQAPRRWSCGGLPARRHQAAIFAEADVAYRDQGVVGFDIAGAGGGRTRPTIEYRSARMLSSTLVVWGGD